MAPPAPRVDPPIRRLVEQASTHASAAHTVFALSDSEVTGFQRSGAAESGVAREACGALPLRQKEAMAGGISPAPSSWLSDVAVSRARKPGTTGASVEPFRLDSVIGGDLRSAVDLVLMIRRWTHRVVRRSRPLLAYAAAPVVAPPSEPGTVRLGSERRGWELTRIAL